MLHPTITKEALHFLKDLKNNNNREWFENHKTEFKRHQETMKGFFNGVIERLKRHDEIEKMKIFRIYRDVRFSKDKTPYKSNFASSFTRAGARLRGGYYLHIAPGGSFVATGFWGPNKEDLFRIRKELEHDATEFRKITGDKSFKDIWGELQGDTVKTAPKGFDKDHQNIDLIRHKQFIFLRKFTDKEVLAKDFAKKVDECYRGIRPYFDYMSEVLTTNLNGESLLN